MLFHNMALHELTVGGLGFGRNDLFFLKQKKIHHRSIKCNISMYIYDRPIKNIYKKP